MARTVQQAVQFLGRYAIALTSVLYLFTVGILFERNRVFLYKVLNHFGYYLPQKTSTIIPEVTLEELADTSIPIEIAESGWVQGNATVFELIALSTLIKKYVPKGIFEIGTFDGRTTLNLALNALADAKVYTIDLAKDVGAAPSLTVTRTDDKLIHTNVTGARFKNAPTHLRNASQKITQLYGDSATFDFSSYYGTVDFVFIDAAHSYEYVVNDSEVAFKLLRGGKGLILWHDYDFSPKKGIVRALNEYQAMHPEWKMFHIKGTCTAGVIFP